MRQAREVEVEVGDGGWGMGEARGEAGVRGSRNKLTGTADLQDHCTFFVHGAGKKKGCQKKVDREFVEFLDSILCKFLFLL